MELSAKDLVSSPKNAKKRRRGWERGKRERRGRGKGLVEKQSGKLTPKYIFSTVTFYCILIILR